MRFRILGHLEVQGPDGWTAISAPKWRSLLACLLIRPGQLVPTDSLIFELWGDNPPSTANNMVSIYVHRLRKEVIGDADGRILVHQAPGYLLRVEPGDVDIQVFESLVAEGRSELAAARAAPAAELLGQALGLWRGPLLADVTRSTALTIYARRATELWLDATELRVEADLACGRAAQLVAELRGLVGDHPMRERLWALLIRALDEAGRRAEAFEAFALARQTIAEELGVEPGSELQRLHAELLAADASSAATSVASASARTAGQRPSDDPAAPAADRAGAAADAAVPAAASAQTSDVDGPHADPPGSIAIGMIVDPDSLSDGDPAAAGARPGAADTAAGAGPPIPRPTQLPTDIGDFTGRETPVAQLSALLIGSGPADNPGAVRIAVVNGAAGLGKTTLAVHAAHQVRAKFPDGQLYVDLNGASAQPAEPAEVLARFLRDLGVEGDKVPVRVDERAALYRTRLTGRRVLILLDNAQDAAQVRQLLPGSSSCAVLVTTRNRTPDLVSTRFVDLNVLEDTEALALFTRIVGEERAAAEPDATAEVLVACAGLPLAIRICAARLAARRQWRVGTLAARLRNVHRRLDELSIGDLAVRASFQVSYDSLRSPDRGVDPARVFRLLGLWQGSGISLAAAAPLAGAPEDDTADALEALVDANLLESPAPDWYRFHDLLRVYATERAEAEESEAARGEAVGRLLRWYLDTAEAAANTVSPTRYVVPREAGAAEYPPLEFASLDDALAWYGDERANIVTATRQAAATGLHEVAWRLPPTLFTVFDRWSNWADCVTTNRVAADSARKAEDRLGEAWVHNVLGFALAKLRDAEAYGHLEQALAIRREFGDTRGEAQTALALGEAYLNMQGPGEAALTNMRRGVELLRPRGVSSLLGVALNNLGDVYYGLGELDSAAEYFAQSRDMGGSAEGYALDNLGRVYRDQHRPADAIASLAASARKHRAFGVLRGEARALKHLGEVQVEIGHVAEARTALTSALKIFEQVGDQAEAAETGSLLGSLADD
ncbi:MAG TPA: BTAD domain-containing putative transcriptional regulator [Trebonia sp.]|nr:BTAD domain-containing putative transcriptional regulator [Trebonia sp.]